MNLSSNCAGCILKPEPSVKKICRLQTLWMILLVSVPMINTSASERPELTVYTYSSFTSSWGPGPVLKEAFESVCECQLNYVSSDDGVSLLNRLRLEGNRTRADVVMGIDHMLIPQMFSAELVKQHHIDLEAFPLKPSLNWQDPYFVPFDYGYFAFIYDQERIDNPVQSMQELIQSDATVIYQDPRTSTPGQGLMHWIQLLYQHEAVDAWRQLSQNTVTVTKGWSEAYAMFLQGEADYVLSYTTSPAYHQLVEEKEQYVATIFSEGHLAQIEVAGVSAFSSQPELARQFLAFLLEADTQAMIAQHNWMLPVRSDVSLPDVFAEAERDTLWLAPEEAEANRRDWLRVWRSAAGR